MFMGRESFRFVFEFGSWAHFRIRVFLIESGVPLLGALQAWSPITLGSIILTPIIKRGDFP